MPSCIVSARCARSLPAPAPPSQHLYRWRQSTLWGVLRARYGTNSSPPTCPRDDNASSAPSFRRLSLRRQKIRRGDSSALLSFALKAIGRSGSIPTPSHSDERNRHSDSSRAYLAQLASLDYEPTVQSIIARFIQNNVNLGAGNGVEDVLIKTPRILSDSTIPTRDRKFLLSRGYTGEDIVFWTKLLVSKDIDDVARMLVTHEMGAQLNQKSYTPVPNSIFLYVIRRTPTASSLRNFVAYGWQQLYRKWEPDHLREEKDVLYRLEKSEAAENAVLDNANVYTMVSRLLRNAGKVWPESVPSVVGMFIYHINKKSEKDKAGLSSEATAVVRHRIAEKRCNRLLRQLAIPSQTHPFHSTEFYERAQFDLLRCMSEYSTPLTITREGYRGIVSVQLRHKKSEREKDWGTLKARSWPPWKEEKTGFDAEKDVTYGASRALKVLWRMRNAGYGSKLWEHVGQIYTGWDLDQSPTIQTRTVLKRKSWDAKDFDPNHRAIWAARIETTRTLQEAWACFLEYKDNNEIGHEEVYIAMLEKVASEQKRVSKQAGSSNSGEYDEQDRSLLLPGDMKEVLAAPVSPKESTYVPVDPPSLDSLAQEMYERDVSLSETSLVLLLENASSMENALKYLDWATKRYPSFSSITVSEPEVINMETVPKRLFTTYLALLCRFRSTNFPAYRRTEHNVKENDSPSLAAVPNVVMAVRLLQLAAPKYRQPWHVVLKLVVDRWKALSGSKFNQRPAASEIMRRFLYAQRLERQMNAAGLKPDLETFRLVAHSLEHAVRSARAVLHQSGSKGTNDLQTPDNIKTARKVLEQGYYINHLFHTVAGLGLIDLRSRSGDKLVPDILASPRVASLHQLVRVLGGLYAWNRMAHFVGWAVKHRDAILAASAMPRNGRVLLRRFIVSVRVFSEAAWVKYEWDEHEEAVPVITRKESAASIDTGDLEKENAAPKSLIEWMKGEIESVEDFGGWPTDDEVIDYCIEGGFVDGKEP